MRRCISHYIRRPPYIPALFKQPSGVITGQASINQGPDIVSSGVAVDAVPQRRIANRRGLERRIQLDN